MSHSTLLWQCLVLEEQIFLDHITSLTLKFDYIITLVSTLLVLCCSDPLDLCETSQV
jgi:hypothetical protein